MHLFWLENSEEGLLCQVLIQVHSSIKYSRPVTSPFPVCHLSKPPCHEGRGVTHCWSHTRAPNPPSTPPELRNVKARFHYDS